MQRKRTADRQQWLYRVYTYKATLHDLSPPQRWPAPLRQVVFAQRDLWNACHAAWDVNRTQYEALMQQGEGLVPLREARETAQQAVDAVQARITARRQQTRKRLYPDWQTDAEALDAARQALRQTRDTLHHAEAAYRVHLRPQLSTLLETLWQTVHDLGQAAPLPWYNERQVTDSFRNCVERFLKHQGGPPKPKRFLDRVHLTYHFTGPPLTWEQLLLGKSSMIVLGDERGKLPERRTHGHLRISDEDTLD